jgi:hypothetical protein
MPFLNTTAAYCESHMKQTSTHHEQIAEFYYVKTCCICIGTIEQKVDCSSYCTNQHTLNACLKTNLLILFI